MQQRQITNDQTGCENGAGFGIFRIRADITDMGISQGDDLFGVGGIGEDFLIPGHGGIEYHFADRMAGGSDGTALEEGTVSQDEDRWYG